MVISQLKNIEGIRYPDICREKSYVKPAKRFFGNPNVIFGLQPEFLNVMQSVDGCDKTKTIFSYKEILQMLSKYICSKRTTIVDPRNLKLALLENDPLGKAFRVKAFHRCQVRWAKNKRNSRWIGWVLARIGEWNINWPTFLFIWLLVQLNEHIILLTLVHLKIAILSISQRFTLSLFQ